MTSHRHASSTSCLQPPASFHTHAVLACPQLGAEAAAVAVPHHEHLLPRAVGRDAAQRAEVLRADGLHQQPAPDAVERAVAAQPLWCARGRGAHWRRRLGARVWCCPLILACRAKPPWRCWLITLLAVAVACAPVCCVFHVLHCALTFACSFARVWTLDPCSLGLALAGRCRHGPAGDLGSGLSAARLLTDRQRGESTWPCSVLQNRHDGLGSWVARRGWSGRAILHCLFQHWHLHPLKGCLLPLSSHLACPDPPT